MILLIKPNYQTRIEIKVKHEFLLFVKEPKSSLLSIILKINSIKKTSLNTQTDGK
jgi:hypothetical protein